MPKILHISPQPKEIAQGHKKCGVDFADSIKKHFQSVVRDLNLESVFVEDQIPELGGPSKVDGIVISGSKLSAYEKDIPWLAPLQDFVRSAVQEEVPMLGICFGHQIITQALGGKVVLGSKGIELGLIVGKLTDEGTRDPLFNGIQEAFVTSSFHSDIVKDLPKLPEKNTRVLAHSSKYPNQALAIGELIRTVQFHPEFSIAMLEALIKKEGVVEDPWVEHSLAQDVVEMNGRRILANFIRHFVIPNQK